MQKYAWLEGESPEAGPRVIVRITDGSAGLVWWERLADGRERVRKLEPGLVVDGSGVFRVPTVVAEAPSDEQIERCVVAWDTVDAVVRRHGAHVAEADRMAASVRAAVAANMVDSEVEE